MLSKKTLELLINITGQEVYKHSQIPHDPILSDWTTAYRELTVLLKDYYNSKPEKSFDNLNNKNQI